MSRLVQYLSRFCAEHRLEKKYLIVPSYQVGHQIGEALAKEGGAWVNLHFATLPSLAQEAAGIELSAQGLKLVLQANALFLVDRVFRRLRSTHSATRRSSCRPRGSSSSGAALTDFPVIIIKVFETNPDGQPSS